MGEETLCIYGYVVYKPLFLLLLSLKVAFVRMKNSVIYSASKRKGIETFSDAGRKRKIISGILEKEVSVRSKKVPWIIQTGCI